MYNLTESQLAIAKKMKKNNGKKVREAKRDKPHRRRLSQAVVELQNTILGSIINRIQTGSKTRFLIALQ